MYGPDLSGCFRAILICLIVSVIAAIGATWFVSKTVYTKKKIKSDTLIKPKIELKVDNSLLKVDTIFVYEN